MAGLLIMQKLLSLILIEYHKCTNYQKKYMILQYKKMLYASIYNYDSEKNRWFSVKIANIYDRPCSLL